MKTVTDYEGYSIELNSVPVNQFDFDGFGWAFQIYQSKTLCFKLVVKSPSGEGDSDYVNCVREWGYEKVRWIINSGEFQQNEIYCYLTERFSSVQPERVKCEGFLLDGSG
jgi:hypothetical protein